MAQPLRVPRTLKPKQSLPPHYYESFLEKKGPRDKVGLSLPGAEGSQHLSGLASCSSGVSSPVLGGSLTWGLGFAHGKQLSLGGCAPLRSQK
uniref:Uncharacterized protein n=1 Tax=Crocodylus porosus TaxID=8502 RepID=A0A7M4EQV3_CROPO